MKNIKLIGILLGSALIIFLAGFLGSIFAIKSFEPQIKLFLQAKEDTDNGLTVINGILTVSGKITGINDNIITIETEPPEDPFGDWYKEIKVKVDKETVIVLGEWDFQAIAEEQMKLLQGEKNSFQLSYGFLKQTPITFEEIEIGRIIIVVPAENISTSGQQIEAARIIVGKAR